MKIRNLFKKIGLLTAGCAVVVLLIGMPALAEDRQVLRGHVPAIAGKLRPIGRKTDTNSINLAIGLPLRHEQELSNLLQQLYDPSSPNYRHFLKPKEFADRFCATEQNYQALVAFAKANHLTVTTTHPNRMILDVAGTATDIENAFKTTLQVFQHPTENRAFYAPVVEPSVPAELQVADISGLNNYTLPHPKYKFNAAGSASKLVSKAGSGPSGNYVGDDFRNAYAPNVILNGAGQKVGLLQFDGYFASDIAAYELLTGRPNVPLLNVLLDGYNGAPSPFGGNVEVSLDIEMVISMAPGVSEIVMYEAGPFGIPNDILNRMATDDLCEQLSCSWGWGGGPSTSTEAIFKQMQAQGQTFFNATGDGDAFLPGQVDDPTFPGSPSSSPNIVQVGGTTLTTSAPGGPWSSEVVWNWGNEFGPNFDGIGSSGGISSFYDIPTYQQGINMSSNMGSSVFRNMPDVALTGDNVLVIAEDGIFFTGTGGTSCAAPLWGGFTALVNQQAAAGGHPSVGFINPAIYAIGKSSSYSNCFHDITAGDDTWSLSPGQFFAVPGYDLCAGWGTPAGQPLIDALSPPVPTASLLVLTNIVSGGNGNGVIDFNECNDLELILTNSGATNATHVQVSLSTTTPGVILAQKTSAYPDILAGGTGTNLTSFKISTTPTFVCGTPVVLTVLAKCDQIISSSTLTLPSGVQLPLIQLTNGGTVNIPDNNPAGADSIITVNNLSSVLEDVTVSVNIIHPRVSDLTLQLIGPDGTTVTLSRTNGVGGANYGLDCFNETTFDDAGGASITTGAAPFVGAFKPEQPLAAFAGKTGAALNGNWRLHVVDSATNQLGFIQCWALNLATSTCTNGGGQCPGVDMAVGISAQPNPATIQSNLSYTITVTNNGPDAAKSVAVSQTLGPGEVFVTGSASQGSVSASGSTVSCTIGNLAAGSNATVTVVVLPTATGVIFSTATVSSSVADTDPSNNSATVGVLVNPALADLGVSMTGNVNPVALGGVLTYTITVTNRGPVTAQNVVATNIVPQNVSVVSVSSSQGGSTTSSSKVVTSLGSLARGANAIITLQVRALAVNPITTTTTVGASTTDAIPANNTASLTTAVSPASDLSLTMTGSPVSAAVGSNITYTLTVQNLGPSPAANVTVNDTLPANVSFVSATCPQGLTSQSSGAVTCTITNLGVNSNAVVTIVINTASLVGQVPVVISNLATVTSANADPNFGNNTAMVSTRVDNPRALVVANGSVLAAEGFQPTNGFIDPHETVTVNFRLQNIGNLNTTNLVATLQATGGVLLTNGPQVQNYGNLPAGGAGISRPFTFAANVTNGGTLFATLQLQDGAANLGTASFTYVLPSFSSFTNTNDIIIPDHGEGTPYPSVINVSGVTGLIDKVTVTLSNMNHTFPDDIGMLLVGPAGQSTLLMSHCGAGGTLSGVAVTLDDFAPGLLPTSSQITSGTYRPTQNGSVSFPLTNTPAGPYGTNFAGSFDGTNANGNWSLYVFDGAPGDQGIIHGGWSLAVATGTPVNDIVDLGVSGAGAPNPVLAGTNLTYTFTITNNGPNVANSIAFTNVLPPSLSFSSATSSLGNCSRDTNGTIFCTLTNLPVGSSFTVTVVAVPTLPGVITNQATVTSSDSDLNQSDNIATVVTTVTPPVADLALGMSALPNPGVAGSNVVYSISVTNNGPGNAFNVVASMPLGNLTFVSAFSSPAVFIGSNANGTATCNLGTLSPGSSGTVLLTANLPQLGLYTNTATVSTASTDNNSANNSATLVVTAANPAPNIVLAGAKLISESFTPTNGTVDPGETVVVSFGFTNAGNAPVTNLLATLLSVNGITPSRGTVQYGAMAPGDPAKFFPIGFTAPATNAGTLTAVFQLQDNLASLGQLSVNFNLPSTNTFANAAGITIPDNGPGQPYPSSINVSGLNGVVSKVTVTLSNFSHAFPNDLEMLLVGPGGQDALLMASAGGATAVTNLTLTFDDAAAATIPRTGPLDSNTNETFKTSPFTLVAPFPGPAPAGPYPSVLSAFNASYPDGIWSLYVLDDSPGDAGSIGGWILNISSVNPVNSAADVGVAMAGPQGVVFSGQNFTYTVNVTNRGPVNATGVTLSQTLLGSLNFVSTTAGSYTNQSGLIVYNLGTVPPGGNVTFNVTVNPATVGFVNSTVTLAEDQADLNTADNSAAVSTSVINLASPHLSNPLFNDGIFTLTVTGIPGQYALQGSADLTNWTTISTNSVPPLGTIQINDSNASSFAHRYYRVLFVGP